MRICTQCGAEVSKESIFCTKCGAKMEEISADEVKENIQIDVKEELAEDTKKSKVVKKKAITVENVKKNKTSKGMLPTASADLLLYLALLCIVVLPGVVESLIMFMTKHSMNQIVVLMINLCGMALGLILLSQYLSTLKSGSKSRERLLMAGSGILWMYVIATVTLRLLESLNNFAFHNIIQMYWIYYIIYALAIFGALVAMSRILARTVNQLIVGHPGKLIRRPKLFWRTLLLLGAALFIIPDMMTIIFSGAIIALPLSFVSTVTEWVATVYVQAILLKLTVDGIVAAADSNGDVAENSEVTKQKFKKIMPFVAVGLVAFFLMFDLISSALYSTVDSIESTIQDDINLGTYYMAVGDIEMSMSMYDNAYAKTNAWKAFLDDDINQLRKLHNDYPEDEQIEYLVAMKSYPISELEASILQDKDTSGWYHLLLDAYKAQEDNEENPTSLLPNQKIIQRDLLNTCIAGQVYINTNITFKDVEGKEKKISKALNPYLEFIDQYGVYKILNKISLNGGINTTIMNELLTNAEENRENLLAQYMAYEAGSVLLYDDAPHYQRTAEAAIRFRDLYLDQLDKDSDVNALTIAINMEVADVLMSLQDYTHAVVYLEEAADMGAEGNIRLITAQCYESLENFDKSLEMSALAVKEDPKDYNALNLAMISALKVGKITESMTYAASLLELMPSLEDLEYLMVDADMYIYVQYLTVSNETQWTPQMKYKVYPDMDEEQLKVLEKNPLLDYYIKAVYFTFGGRDFGQAWVNTEELLKMMPDSAQITYLAGTIHFNKKEFETAAKYYSDSLEIDDTAPTLWYALANAYDAMEEYQQAYNCTLEVLELMQYSNHAVDIYGVQYHNNALMKSLASKIEQEGN